MVVVYEPIKYLYQREGISIDTLSTERKATIPIVYRLVDLKSILAVTMATQLVSEEDSSLVTRRQETNAHAYKRSAYDTVTSRLFVKRSIVSHYKSRNSVVKIVHGG
jgi:hypothetical protein